MRFINEADWDRAVRMLVGIGLLMAGWEIPAGVPAAVLLAVGAIALGTGLAGWCPAYTAFGVATRRVAAPHCPNCETDHRH